MAGLMVSLGVMSMPKRLLLNQLTIRGNDTARLIPGLWFGMISMMVFSFTMVMTTPVSASATLSPSRHSWHSQQTQSSDNPWG